MKTFLGEEGLDKTWQADFPKSIRCHKCRSDCRIMFVAYEDSLDKNFVCGLHDNTSAEKDGKYWLHDAIACAVYLCEGCFEPNALINQA